MSYTGPNPVTQSFIAGTEFFSGVAGQTNFVISRQIGSPNDILVSISGVEVSPALYSIVTNNTIAFNTAPPVGVNNIVVRYMSTVLWQSVDVSSAGSGYLYRLIDVNSSFAVARLTQTVTAVNTLTTLTLSSVIGLGVGSTISATQSLFTGQVITAIVGNVVTVASTAGWGTIGTVTVSDVYLWNIPVDNTPLIYDTNTQKWINGAAQLVFSSSNVGLGNQSLYNTPSTATNNIALGNNTLKALTTGNNHMALGDGAGSAITTSSNNIILGDFTGLGGGLDIRATGVYGNVPTFRITFTTGTSNISASTLTLSFGAVATVYFPILVVSASIAGGSNLATVITAALAALTANTIITGAWIITSDATGITLTGRLPVTVGFPITFGSNWSLAPATGLVGTATGVEGVAYSTSGNIVVSDQSANIRALCTPAGQWGIGTVNPVALLHVQGPARLQQTYEQLGIDSTTALSGTILYGINSGALTYYSSPASGNWIFNFTGTTGASPATLNSVMAVNHSLTIAFITTQGAVAYYCTSVTIDGVAPSTFRWQGSVRPSYGNPNGNDVYVFSILKTAPGVFVVLGALTQYGA